SEFLREEQLDPIPFDAQTDQRLPGPIHCSGFWRTRFAMRPWIVFCCSSRTQDRRRNQVALGLEDSRRDQDRGSIWETKRGSIPRVRSSCLVRGEASKG